MSDGMVSQRGRAVGQQPVAVAAGKDKMPGLLVVALALSVVASTIYIVRTLAGK